MGMIFLYIHIPHIFFISFPHNRHKQTIPAGSPVPCLFIYSLSAYISLVGFFSRRPPPLVLVSVFAPAVPFSVVVPVAVDCVSLLPACRLVVSSGVPSFVSLHIVPFRSSSRRACRRNGAPFLSARFLVSSRKGVAFRRAVPLVVLLVGQSCVSGFPPSRRASREASRAASRAASRLSASRVGCLAVSLCYGRHRLGCFICHRLS